MNELLQALLVMAGMVASVGGMVGIPSYFIERGSYTKDTLKPEEYAGGFKVKITHPGVFYEVHLTPLDARGQKYRWGKVSAPSALTRRGAQRNADRQIAMLSGQDPRTRELVYIAAAPGQIPVDFAKHQQTQRELELFDSVFQQLAPETRLEALVRRVKAVAGKKTRKAAPELPQRQGPFPPPPHIPGVRVGRG